MNENNQYRRKQLRATYNVTNISEKINQTRVYDALLVQDGIFLNYHSSRDRGSWIIKSSLSALYITDSIKITTESQQCDKIKVVSIAKLMAEAMKRISEESSVSSLFEDVS